MALLGEAALAMWWNIAPDWRDEFQHWHSHEHFPERMAVPGFLRGSRWAGTADGSDGCFVLYEIDRHRTLASPAYRARLDAPSDWSRRMMPLHRDMVRSQCRIAASAGGVVAAALQTVRLAPQHGRAEPLREYLSALLPTLAGRPGVVGAHLLLTDAPTAPATTEQRIRGGDGEADWIVLLCGYEPAAIRALLDAELGARALQAAGGTLQRADAFALNHAAIPADVS